MFPLALYPPVLSLGVMGGGLPNLLFHWGNPQSPHLRPRSTVIPQFSCPLASWSHGANILWYMAFSLSS